MDCLLRGCIGCSNSNNELAADEIEEPEDDVFDLILHLDLNRLGSESHKQLE